MGSDKRKVNGCSGIEIMGDQRFIADAMLGKLTKWLRVIGVDVRYDPYGSDRQVLWWATQEGRIILTRDRRLGQRCGTAPHLWIASDYYHEQLRQVVQTFGLEHESRLFTRCLRCNTPLREVAKQAVAGKVPPYVFGTQPAFKHCAACDRFYWSGTHRDNMGRQLHIMLGGIR